MSETRSSRRSSPPTSSATRDSWARTRRARRARCGNIARRRRRSFADSAAGSSRRWATACCLEFPSVVAAVECAIRMQQQMAERNAGIPEARRILYRIGVNLGDVLIDGEDILGDGVNIAARLEAICEPGGICISGSAYDHVRGRIEAEFADLGEKALKNIARPVRAYALGVADIACAKVLTPAAPHATEAAVRARAARRRACGAAHRDRGRRVVAPQCEPARKRRHEGARRGRAAFDRRAALRQSVGRSGAGLPRRRPDRRTDHQLSRASATPSSSRATRP